MKKRSSGHQGLMRVMVLQTGDCQAVKEKQVLGQIPDRDMVWRLGMGS